MYHVPSNREQLQRMTCGAWLHWLIVSGLGFIAGQVAALLLAPLRPYASMALILFLYGIAMCVATAGVQWLLFLRKSSVPPRWIGLTAPGGLIVGAIAAFVNAGDTSVEQSILAWIIALGLGLFGVQWLTLRRYHRRAGELVAAEMLVGLAIVLMVLGLGESLASI